MERLVASVEQAGGTASQLQGWSVLSTTRPPVDGAPDVHDVFYVSASGRYKMRSKAKVVRHLGLTTEEGHGRATAGENREGREGSAHGGAVDMEVEEALPLTCTTAPALC